MAARKKAAKAAPPPPLLGGWGVSPRGNDRGEAFKWVVIKPVTGEMVRGGADTRDWAETEAKQVYDEARAAAGDRPMTVVSGSTGIAEVLAARVG